MKSSGLYDNNEKLKDYINEGKKLKTVYDPYRGWKYMPNYTGTYFNTDQYGRRFSEKLNDSINHVNIGFFWWLNCFWLWCYRRYIFHTRNITKFIK